MKRYIYTDIVLGILFSSLLAFLGWPLLAATTVALTCVSIGMVAGIATEAFWWKR